MSAEEALKAMTSHEAETMSVEISRQETRTNSTILEGAKNYSQIVTFLARYKIEEDDAIFVRWMYPAYRASLCLGFGRFSCEIAANGILVDRGAMAQLHINHRPLRVVGLYEQVVLEQFTIRSSRQVAEYVGILPGMFQPIPIPH